MELVPEGILPPENAEASTGVGAVAEIESLLDEERAEAALARALGALEAGEGNELDVLFLAGEAALALGRGAEAERMFRAILAKDPDCPASRGWLAKALYLQWRFEEAEVAVREALAVDEAPVEAHALQACLLDRRGEVDMADACYRRANAIAPDTFPPPLRLGRAEFDREVQRAVRRLPRRFRRALDRVSVEVHPWPDPSLANGEDAGHVLPDILGLFDGVPLAESGEVEVGEWRPSRILLFQRNLECASFDHDDLVEQVRITLWHELAHYLGFEEEDMDDLGLA